MQKREQNNSMQCPNAIHEKYVYLQRISIQCQSSLWRAGRRIFGPKKDDVTREWRRLHTEELYALYSTPNIIRNIKSRILRQLGQVARMEDRRDTCTVLVGRHEGRRRRWEEYIKLDLQEVGSWAWTGLLWLRTGSGGRRL